MRDIQYVPLVVDDKPYCFWDFDLAERDREFLKGIDPRYFDHMAQMHCDQLKSEQSLYAALALRATYSHALESLFSLICATVQSPQFIVGWLLKYFNTELEYTVEKIHTGQPIQTKLSIHNPVTWRKIADTIFQFQADEADKERIRLAYANLWERMADDFLDKNIRDEYNPIKHGFRQSMAGGSHLWIGVEDTPGVPAKRMNYIGGSEFGTSFFVEEKLHERNFRITRKSLNWNPEKFIPALHLISQSIENIVVFLKHVHGMDISDLRFSVPEDPSYFEEPWNKVLPGVFNIEFNDVFDINDIKQFSKAQIQTIYTSGIANAQANMGQSGQADST